MNCISPVLIGNKKTGEGMLVPCGHCIMCRIKRRSEWTMRLQHESEYWKKKCFVTLTYDDDKLYSTGMHLRYDDLPLFIKRLRNCFRDRRIKYFACGEYGGQFHRPHFHLILFGVGINDIIANARKLWYDDRGAIIAERVCFETMRYVAGYVCDKLVRNASVLRYGDFPPFQRQSQGIGLQWAKDHVDHMRVYACIKTGNRSVSIPRYYLKKLFPRDDEANLSFYERLHGEVEKRDDECLEKAGFSSSEIDAYRSGVRCRTVNFFDFSDVYQDDPALRIYRWFIDRAIGKSENVLKRMNMRRLSNERLSLRDFANKYNSVLWRHLCVDVGLDDEDVDAVAVGD